MNNHQLRLAAAPFNAIVSGQKSIESRLYDKKRQLIRLGDAVEFINREVPEQSVSAKVIGLLRYQTFHDLFSHNDPLKFGGESVEWLEQQMSEFYSIDDQRANGVVGIEYAVL